MLTVENFHFANAKCFYSFTYDESSIWTALILYFGWIIRVRVSVCEAIMRICEKRTKTNMSASKTHFPTPTQ